MPTPAEVEYYTANLLNRCCGCYKSLDNNTKSTDRDTVDGIIVCEEKIVCKTCGVQVDYFAYGHWEGDNYRQQFETQHPKAAELIRKMVGV
jgi:hypothetical protein